MFYATPEFDTFSTVPSLHRDDALAIMPPIPAEYTGNLLKSSVIRTEYNMWNPSSPAPSRVNVAPLEEPALSMVLDEMAKGGDQGRALRSQK